MSPGAKRLEAMRGNAAGAWRIEDVELVCRTFGVQCASPRRGSHHTVSHPGKAEILTIPSRRPIKPVYIRSLVAYIDDVRRGADEQG
jgi:predicted RNA binding protein YcfA (HicA-like mRNA interferase family)